MNRLERQQPPRRVRRVRQVEPLVRTSGVRYALTLVELLVVMAIIVVMMGVAIPLMRASLEEGKVREGARQVNAFVALAKAHAAESRRDFGIWIERSPNDANAAFEVYLAERPRPFAGDLIGARTELFDTDGDGVADRAMFLLRDVASMSPTVSRPLVQAGDFIRFDYKGPYYRLLGNPRFGPNITITGGTPPTTQTLVVDFERLDAAHPVPRPVSPTITGPVATFGTVPFQFVRSPQKVLTRPLQFAGGVVIDLQHSGMGYSRFSQFDLVSNDASALGPPIGSASTPVVIMFKPTGGVSEVIYWDNSLATPAVTTHIPNGSISLLVGLFDGRLPVEETGTVPNPIAWSSADPTQASYSKNLADHGSSWVSINPRNGAVTSARNAWELVPVAGPYLRDSLVFAREFAQSGQQVGGG